jgi:hypothetical protein
LDSALFQARGVRFDQELPNHEDWECWMRVLRHEPAIVCVREKLAVYRLQAAQLTSNLESMKIGFRQAMEKQFEMSADDEDLRGILTFKMLIMDDFYSRQQAIANLQTWLRDSREEHRRLVDKYSRLEQVSDALRPRVMRVRRSALYRVWGQLIRRAFRLGC